jgi:hypothetical protein
LTFLVELGKVSQANLSLTHLSSAKRISFAHLSLSKPRFVVTV